MVTIRRLQTRRALSRLSGARLDPAVTAVLDAVEDQPDCTVSAVAAALAVDQPRASRMVAKAVEAGLVRRQADQADGRRSILRLTASGRRQAERTHDFRRSVFAEAMADWPPKRQAMFARMLTEFAENYSEITAVS